jgi:hypothetical protein
MMTRAGHVAAPATGIGRWLFVLCVSVYAFTAGGSLTTSDAVQAFDVTRNIVEHGTVEMAERLAPAEALRGRDGRFYSPFGIVQSLYNIPFYLAGKAAAFATGGRIGKPDTLPKAAVAMGQTLVVAAIVWQIFSFSTHVTGTVIPSLLAAVSFAFGSALWPYARFGFGQPLACFALVAAVRAAWLGLRQSETRHLVAAGVWWSVGLMTRHEIALALHPLAAWLWFGRSSRRDRLRRFAAFAPGVFAGLAAWLTFNAIRFGNPLDSGHLRDPVPGFGSPIVEGLLGLLFSPSASLFLYSPVALFGLAGLMSPLWRRDRATAAWLVSLVLIFLLFYATLGNWIGGRSYGSRYLLIILPFLAVGWAALLAAVDRGAQLALAGALLLVGIVVQAPGVLVDYAKVSQTVAAERGGSSPAERQWAWTASPLVMNSVAAIDAVPSNLRYVLGRAPLPHVTPTAEAGDQSFSQQFAFSLDFWWLYLFYMGVLSRAGVLAIMIAGLAAVVFAARGLVRRASQSSLA